MALSSHFRLPKKLQSSIDTVHILRFASVKWRDRRRGSKHRNKRSNFRLHRPSSHRKNESNLYQKLLEIGNGKRDCAWGCARRKNTTWEFENLQIEKHKSVRWAEPTPSWLVLFDLQIFSGGVCPPSATCASQSLFLFPIVFWCYL